MGKNIVPAARTCSIEGCGGKVRTRGWCSIHYQRWSRHGDPEKTLLPRDRVCDVAGCGGKHHGRGWCSMHWDRWHKYGDPEKVTQAPAGEPLKLVIQAAKCLETGCIIWPWSTRTDGYGQVYYEGKNVSAHRLALCLATNKPYSYDLEAAHGPCNEPLCINPHVEHGMRWATRQQNADDMLRDGTRLIGEKHASAKITTQQVIAIRSDPRTLAVIAAEYGLGMTQVSRIKNRQTWKHVK